MAKGGRHTGGNPGNKGGNGNSGRKPNWFRYKCNRILDKRKLLDFCGAVAAGDLVDERSEYDPLTKSEAWVPCKATIKDRLKAIEFLTSYGHGLPVQSLEHGGVGGTPFIVEVVDFNREKIAKNRAAS